MALWLGHRVSVDFDFMTSDAFDPHDLAARIPCLSTAAILQSSANTLTARVERGEPVKRSFSAVPSLGRVQSAVPTSDAVRRVASLRDLAGTKVVTVQRRAEAKDDLDLDAILAKGRLRRDEALAAARIIHGPRANPQLALTALVHVEDGVLPTLPDAVRARLVQAVDAVDLSRLPVLTPEDRHREDGP